MITQKTYDKETVLEVLNISEVVFELLPEGKTQGNEYLSRCPSYDHEDKNPSFSINPQTGRYKCFGCEISGDIFHLYVSIRDCTYSDAINQLGERCPVNPNGHRKAHNQPEPIDKSVVDKLTTRNPDGYLNWLTARRGISEEVGKRFQLGCKAVGKNEFRMTIPIVDIYGKVMNIRLWLAPVGKYEDPLERKATGKMKSWADGVEGRGQARLYPIDQLQADDLVLCEGELDALALISHGIPAITATGGAGTWKPEWSPLFKGKIVTIAYDNDEAGAKGAEKVGASLVKKGVEVKLLAWPDGLEEGYDVSDQVLEDIDGMKQLIVTASEWRASEQADWPDPIPFDDYSKLPGFPVEMLPDTGREMIEIAAECYQVDVGLPATVFLGVLATALQKKVEVSLGTHKEPVNLFLISVLPSGERKSPTFREMTSPVYEYQEAQAETMASEIRKSEIDHYILSQRLKEQQGKAAKSKTPVDREEITKEARATADELAKNPIIKAPVYAVDDITPESLGIVMSENDEKISIMSAEGDIFSILAGRYNGSPNLGLCLKGYSGDPYSNHRVGRKSYSMKSPALTLSITVQPDIIADIGQNKTFRGLGLLARNLYSADTPRAGYRLRTRAEIPPEIQKRYSRHLKDLLAVSPESPHVLQLTDAASQIWDDFYNDVEMSMRPGGQLEGLKDWGSKLPGNVARIAGLLHCAKHGEEAVRKDISDETTINAVVIGRYYLAHALAAFGMMMQDPQIEAAKKILEYLIDKKPTTFKGRDVLRNKSHFNKIDEVNEGLVLLLERGYFREIQHKSTKIGRPTASEYEVNPRIIMP